MALIGGCRPGLEGMGPLDVSAADTRPPEPRDPARASSELPSITSAELLRGHAELQILHHDGTVYRLRVTGRGKLILTK